MQDAEWISMKDEDLLVKSYWHRLLNRKKNLNQNTPKAALNNQSDATQVPKKEDKVKWSSLSEKVVRILNCIDDSI